MTFTHNVQIKGPRHAVPVSEANDLNAVLGNKVKPGAVYERIVRLVSCASLGTSWSFQKCHDWGQSLLLE
ncbi:hypothetical protein D9M70_488240 [compost metagenome]